MGTLPPYAATAPLPPGISELLMAGFLNGRGIPMVRGKTVPLRVPANAEIVIEGFVRTDAGGIDFDPRRDGEIGPGAVFEGPFGDHTGFYSLPDRYPIVEVTAITHRRDAVYPTTVVGLPPQEDYYLGKATERLFLPLLKTIVHDIDDYPSTIRLLPQRRVHQDRQGLPAAGPESHALDLGRRTDGLDQVDRGGGWRRPGAR